MFPPRRFWWPVFVDTLLALVAVGFVMFLIFGLGCASVNVVVGEGVIEKETGAVVIKPKRGD